MIEWRTKPRRHPVVHCDECDKIIRVSLSCVVCHKDLCYDCLGGEEEYNEGGWRWGGGVLCKGCWEANGHIREARAKEMERHIAEMDRIDTLYVEPTEGKDG